MNTLQRRDSLFVSTSPHAHDDPNRTSNIAVQLQVKTPAARPKTRVLTDSIHSKASTTSSSPVPSNSLATSASSSSNNFSSSPNFPAATSYNGTSRSASNPLDMISPASTNESAFRDASVSLAPMTSANLPDSLFALLPPLASFPLNWRSLLPRLLLAARRWLQISLFPSRAQILLLCLLLPRLSLTAPELWLERRGGELTLCR